MLELIKYSAGYKKGQYLFNETSLVVSKGEILGVVGLNGTGKSTFLKGIINLVPYKTGNILINGDDISKYETNQIMNKFNIGYLSQRNRIFNNLTVREHIKLQQLYSNNKFNFNSDIFNNLYSKIELRENYFASSLSGGEQLILNLICLMILDPEIILLDEPSDSLDFNFKEDLKKLLLFWESNNKAIVLIEQNVELLDTISDITIKI